MSRSRIVGKNLTIEIDGESYECDLVSVVLERVAIDTNNADSVQTFCQVGVAGATTKWQMTTKAIQSTDSGAQAGDTSLWTAVYDTAASGGGNLTFTFAPYGNATPSTSQPHFTGSIVVADFPSLGGEAGNNAFTWEMSFDLADDELTRVTSAT